MKLRKYCCWAPLGKEPAARLVVWRCSHPLSRLTESPDYVTGKPPITPQLTCAEARLFDDHGYCGPRGRFWQLR